MLKSPTVFGAFVNYCLYFYHMICIFDAILLVNTRLKLLFLFFSLVNITFYHYEVAP